MPSTVTVFADRQGEERGKKMLGGESTYCSNLLGGENVKSRVESRERVTAAAGVGKVGKSGGGALHTFHPPLVSPAALNICLLQQSSFFTSWYHQKHIQGFSWFSYNPSVVIVCLFGRVLFPLSYNGPCFHRRTHQEDEAPIKKAVTCV